MTTFSEIRMTILLLEALSVLLFLNLWKEPKPSQVTFQFSSQVFRLTARILLISVQILGAIAEVTMNTGFPAGWLLARSGSRVTSTAAMLMAASGYCLLWVGVQWKEHTHFNFWILCFVFALVGKNGSIRISWSQLIQVMANH